MAGYEDNLKRIDIVAKGLGKLVNDSIFIGGACTQFYVDNPLLQDFRPTRDIDCLVKVYTYKEFAAYSDKLRNLGFVEDTSEGAPITRWVYKKILVDIIPDKCSVVGFRNVKWFEEGRKYAEERTLPSGTIIKVLPFTYYMATKLDSWKDRGIGDFFASKDIEDIIGIIDGNNNLNDLYKAPANVRNYVAACFSELISNESFKRSIVGHIGFDLSASERARYVVKKIIEVIDIGQS